MSLGISILFFNWYLTYLTEVKFSKIQRILQQTLKIWTLFDTDRQTDKINLFVKLQKTKYVWIIKTKQQKTTKYLK